jgi:UDP-2-acetamido-3-amino-2,3-dideoxy-glucuronate N-acetyltransferase
MKISVIGCGYWGKNLVRNFSELGVLYAVCDANSELVAKTSADYGVLAQTFEQMLSSDVNGIVIAAPAAQHFELARKALTFGKHVFVEKPLCLTTEDAEQLCHLSTKTNRKLMVGHLLQYHSAFLAIKQLVDSGDLGRLQYLYSNRLNLGKFRNEENVLWSFAPHDISMILSLVGCLPETVYSTGTSHLNPPIHDATTTHMVFKDNIQAHVFVSWLHPYKEQKLVVIGDRGMVVFDDGLPWSDKLKLYPHQINWIDGFPQPTRADFIHVPLEVSEPLKTECQHFIECIAQDTDPRTDGLEGLRVLRVLETAEQSLRSGVKVRIHQANPSYFVHETALVDEGCEIGPGTKIWHFSHLIKGTKIGEDCVIGQNVMIGPDVLIGKRCKVQNNVSLYKGVTLEDGVFCGPSCVFTNVHNPRAEIERKEEFRQTYVERGVTIGANATIVCGNHLGAYSLIGAGSVVTKDVKPHAVMVGNPAKQIGWVSHAGEKLGGDLVCPREGRRYKINHDGHLIEVEMNKHENSRTTI